MSEKGSWVFGRVIAVFDARGNIFRGFVVVRFELCKGKQGTLLIDVDLETVHLGC